jgi:hypothetical protein
MESIMASQGEFDGMKVLENCDAFKNETTPTVLNGPAAHSDV